MSEGIIQYLLDNPIQLIILIVITLSTIACIVLLAIAFVKSRKQKSPSNANAKAKPSAEADASEKASAETDESENAEAVKPTAKQKREKPVKASKETAQAVKKAHKKAEAQKPAPYPTIDGLEEHFLPTKPPIPLRTTPLVPPTKATPSRAPIPTLTKPSASSTAKSEPIPMRSRTRPLSAARTTEAVKPTEEKTAQSAEEVKPVAPIEPSVPATTAVEPIQETVEQTALPYAEADEPIPEIPPIDTVEETENMENDIDFMKNSESKAPLAAKSLLLATQKMMGINPTEKTAPEKTAAKPEPKTTAKTAAKPEPKATAKAVAKPEPKATAKTAAKPEPKATVKTTNATEAKPEATAAKEEKFTVKKATTGKATEFKASAATFKSLKSPTVKKKKPKSARYTGKWVICRLLLTDGDDEQLEERYYFELRASNGEPLISSEEYLTYEGAEKGIQTHKENILSDNFRIVPRGNEYVFKLLTAKNTLLCTGTPYKTVERCESAVASAKRFAATAIVQEEPEDVAIKIPDDDDFDTTEIDESYIKGRWVIMTGGNERIGTVYYFELLDGAGKKLLISEEYATYEGAVNAVATYKTNIAKGNFRISVTKRGDYMFKLLGGNNQLLCLGEHFPSRRRCEWAIEVVRAFSRNSAVYKYSES